MGVANTLPNYKSFTFDGTNSRAYGVYITGEGVFNAPERNVELVEIPGRNGAYALDKGNFNNIEVTYPAGIFADTEADFAKAVSDLRNFLCSKSGYCRLEDDYNSGEYRMAVYKSGLDVSHDMLIAGEFNIVFECKPQRFLTSGETAVAVANNGTINNPTLFKSKPVLKVQGYGSIGINSDTISVQSIPVGQILLANSQNIYINYPYYNQGTGNNYVGSQIIDSSKLNAGDTFTLGESSYTYTMTASFSDNFFWKAEATDQTGTGVSTTAIMGEKSSTWTTTFAPITLTKGTASSVTHTYKLKWGYGDTPNYGYSGTWPVTIVMAYDGANEISLSSTEYEYDATKGLTGTGFLNSIDGFSTVQISGDITIDLDIGDAYWNNSGTIMNANNAVTFGAKLPMLNPGSNTITYPNTLTSFKVIPNWWKV